MKKCISILGMIFVLAGCASSPVSLDPAQNIDGGICQWKFTGDMDFESQQKGAGTAKNYTCILGNATIYKYNLGKTDWKFGDKEFMELTVATVKDSLQSYKAKGTEATYVALANRKGEVFVIHGKPLMAVRFDLKAIGGRKSTSYLFLTEDKGEILKYRISYGGTNVDFLQKVSLMLLIKSLPAPVVSSGQ